MGSKKSKQTSTQTVQLDPQTKALNDMRLQQEQAYAPVRAAAVNELGRVFNPSNTLPTGLLRSPYTLSTGEQLPGINASDLYSRLLGLANMQFASPEEAFAASRLAALTDTSGLEGAARTTLDKVVAPQLLAQLTASGMGRGGAVGEALQKAGAQFALPIEQARMSGEQNLASFISSLGQRRQNFAAGASQPMNFFQSAPTTTTVQKTTEPSNIFGSILGFAGNVLGGPIGGKIASGIGNLFGGSSGGGMIPSGSTFSMGNAFAPVPFMPGSNYAMYNPQYG